MKLIPIVFALTLLNGCGAAKQDAAQLPASASVASMLTGPVTTPPDGSKVDANPGSSPPAITLTAPAADQIRKVLDDTFNGKSPENAYLAMAVDFDDEKYCTGYRYKLSFEANPSQSDYIRMTSQGIKVAVDRHDLEFLRGTVLDFATLANGEAGFVFRNPNEKTTSIPKELRTP